MQASFARHFLQTFVAFELFSRGYSFHLCCFGNYFLIKFKICILKPRLGGDFGYSEEQNSRNIFWNIFLFRNIPNERALSLVSIVKIHQTCQISKHLEGRQKYSSLRVVFSTFFWWLKCGPTLSVVF